MLLLTLGVSQWIASLLVALFLLVCLLLILIVLIQRPQGGGLSGAFGAGGGSGQTAFGAKTGDALTIATIGIFVLYLGLAVGLQFAAKPSGPPKTTATVGAPGGAEDGAGDAVPDDASTGETEGDALPNAETSDDGVVPGDETSPVLPDAGGEPAAETETDDGTNPDGG